MRPIWVSGEGEHGVRPYNVCVGAKRPKPEGADVGSRHSMFALPPQLALPDIRTRFLL